MSPIPDEFLIRYANTNNTFVQYHINWKKEFRAELNWIHTRQIYTPEMGNNFVPSYACSPDSNGSIDIHNFFDDRVSRVESKNKLHGLEVQNASFCKAEKNVEFVHIPKTGGETFEYIKKLN